MLRNAYYHFISLKPYRWRLERLIELTKPPYEMDHKAAQAALDALDRFAARVLSPEDLIEFKAPWFPPDQV